MAARKSQRPGAVGVADHAGWAILVTVDGAGRFVDRRRVELVDDELPKMPYHHDAQGLPLEQAVALVERLVADHRARGGICVVASHQPFALADARTLDLTDGPA